MNQEQNPAPGAPMEDDQAAALQLLQQGAQSEPDPAAEYQEAAALSNQARIQGELSGLITTFVTLAGPVLPSLKTIYTPEATEQAAGAVAAVCVKHGWLQEGIMQGYQEEITAALVLAPLGFATWHGVKGDLARLKQIEGEAKPAEAATAYQEPGAGTVTFGTVGPVAGGEA